MEYENTRKIPYNFIISVSSRSFNLRSIHGESAASTGTAQMERQFHRKQSAVYDSHNVPFDRERATFAEGEPFPYISRIMKTAHRESSFNF